MMFGWEFPPHISGGLGTASYGLTRGLSHIPDLEVLFVVPKAFGDEDQSVIRLIGANQVEVRRKRIKYKGFQKSMEEISVGSYIVPYTDPEEFWNIKKKSRSDQHKLIETDSQGKVPFSGTYGKDLMHEIWLYSVVAEVISRENEFDLIHAHDWLAYPAGIAAKKVSGKPLVIHVHATDFDRSGGSVNPEVYRLEKEGMDLADRIITVSNLTRNTVITNYGIPAEKVTTVYNAVEPVHLPDNLPYQKSMDDRIITFLGRITLQKGPEYFIEAAYKVLRKMKKVRFVMAGSGDMMARMIHRAAELRIVDRFHFTGFLRGDNVFHMLTISDVYVMPSVSEPFGISPLEAMQSNVPVIISKQSGVAEILTHAVKVDFWDIDAMADAIYGILSYPALSETFKTYGKMEVDQLKWENSARQVKRIYDAITE